MFVVHFFLALCVLNASIFFFFNDTATTEIYTLSLHDALPISLESVHRILLPDSATRSVKGTRSRAAIVSDRLLRLSRSEEHTSELQSQSNLVCRLLLENKTARYDHEVPRPL